MLLRVQFPFVPLCTSLDEVNVLEGTMLVLTRKKGEKIVVGKGLVTITIVDIKDGRVRVGIEAPRELSVHREEIQKLRDQVSEGDTSCQQ